MGALKLLRPLTAVLSGLVFIGCYSTAPLRLQVQSRTDDQRCVHTTDRVFADAGFQRIGPVLGPDMFYTPRTNPGTEIPLGWGIGAWVNRDQRSESCAVTLQALSADPVPGQPRTFSSQRGDPFDATVRDMAKRLELAFEAPQ
jgi:hypothetical protein